MAMLLTRWEPFRDLVRLQDEMARLFEDRTLMPKAGESVGWTPLADVYEDGDALTLRFEVAGVDPAAVEIRYENGILTVVLPKRPEAKPRSIQVKVS